MSENITNRDLYRLIVQLGKERKDDPLTLQQYLQNLRALARPWQHKESLSSASFVDLLKEAFDPTSTEPPGAEAKTESYQAWDADIELQIRDLQEMKEAGILENKMRYFGVDAPRGARWYNFDPGTYLECAVAGAFGGWEESDDSPRSYVPGPVATLDPSGALSVTDPRDLTEPTSAIAEVSWSDFADFLHCGRCYE